MKAWYAVLWVILIGYTVWKGLDFTMFNGPKIPGLEDMMNKNDEKANYASYFVDDYEYDDNGF